MLFFLIIPAWLLFLLIGMGMVCFQAFRRTGIYVIAVPTGAALVSLVLSTSVLYLGPRIGSQLLGRWSGGALIGIYLPTVLIGGFCRYVAGLVLTRRLLARR